MRPLRSDRFKAIIVKEYNIKRDYCTKHASKFDGIESQLLFDKIEQFKNLSMQEMFHAYAKDTELVTKLSFKIFEVIAEKGRAYSVG